MALNIHSEYFKYSGRTGYYYDPSNKDDPEEVLEFLKTFTDSNMCGWIQTTWGTASIKSHSDGKGAVFIKQHLNKETIVYFTKLLGEKPTQLLLRHHT